ncbi:MAG: hypothetical protein ACU85V_12380 [Gammaproteobacteria bacterium]
MSNARRRLAAITALPFLLVLDAEAAEVSAECRGVAAGVVAAMRASGELTGDDQVQAAVVAARRACSAALESLGAGGAAASAPAPATQEATAQAAGEKEKFSLWDLLTADQERKPGNERLRRLKQQ